MSNLVMRIVRFGRRGVGGYPGLRVGDSDLRSTLPRLGNGELELALWEAQSHSNILTNYSVSIGTLSRSRSVPNLSRSCSCSRPRHRCDSAPCPKVDTCTCGQCLGL